MKNAPIVLVWTSTNKDYGPMHAGSSYQNVGLFAVAHKMGAVVRGYFDKAKVREALKLKPNEEVLISMAVGYPIFTDKDDKDVPDGALNPDVSSTSEGLLNPDVAPTPNGVSKPKGVPTPNGVPTPEGLLNPDVALTSDGVLKSEGVPTPAGVPTPELKAPELKSNNPVQAPVPSQGEGTPLTDTPKTQSSEASKDLKVAS